MPKLRTKQRHEHDPTLPNQLAIQAGKREDWEFIPCPSCGTGAHWPDGWACVGALSDLHVICNRCSAHVPAWMIQKTYYEGWRKQAIAAGVDLRELGEQTTPEV